MHKSIVVALASLFAMNVAFAQATPATPATPAAPAAKAEEKKDMKAAAKADKKAGDCEARAVSKKDGKPLHGAAKNAFMKKCQADAKKAAK